MSHIGFAERVAIEAGLARHESLAAIANQINVQPRAVSEEIRKNRSLLPSARYNGKDCKFADDCRRRFVCGNIRCLGKLVHSTKFNAKFKTFHNNILSPKRKIARYSYLLPDPLPGAKGRVNPVIAMVWSFYPNNDLISLSR